MRSACRQPAALLLAAAALAGCGSSSGEDEGGTGAGAEQGVGQVRAGSTAQLADCTDWQRGSVAQRKVTIRSIRGQLTPQSSETARSALSDEAAYRILDKSCSSGVADSLRLYKLYARAQSFAPLTGEASK